MFINNDVVIFEECVEKVAEARIAVSAINSITGLDITVNPLSGEACAVIDGAEVPIEFEFCCSLGRVFFRPTLLVGRIVNCGWLNGAILIRSLETGNVVTCINVALPFQSEVAAPAVRPTDIIREQAVEDEGSALCIVFDTNTFTGLSEPVLIVKCIILVLITVIQGESVVCPPTTQAPTTQPPTTCCPPTTMGPISCPPDCLLSQDSQSLGASSVKICL